MDLLGLGGRGLDVRLHELLGLIEKLLHLVRPRVRAPCPRLVAVWGFGSQSTDRQSTNAWDVWRGVTIDAPLFVIQHTAHAPPQP